MASAPLDVVIIPMQFPVHSETFISARLRSLLSMGHRLRVYALRGSAPGGEELARERAVDSIPTDHNGLRASLRGTVEALKRPVLLADTLTWLFGATRRSLPQLARSLVVLPRSFDILGRLEKDPPDVLHAEWGHYPTIVARLVQQRLPGTVVSISLIAYDLATQFGGTVDVVRDADVVRTQARANVEHITRFAGIDEERVSVVPDGVEFARVRRVYGRAPKVAGRGVVAGRLVPAKGIDDAIRAFALARRAAHGATLHVLGAGPDMPRLTALTRELGVADVVAFLGHVSQERVIEELSSAEVLIHLSHSERLPNVVKEAMACRCVCVTTRTVGIEELVEHGATGYIVEHGDVHGAARLVADSLANAARVAAIGEAAYRFVATHFDHETSVRRLAGLWSAVRTGSTTPTTRPLAHARAR